MDSHERLEHYKHRLREALHHASATELARQTGVGRVAIQRFKVGKKSLANKNLDKLAEALNIPFDIE